MVPGVERDRVHQRHGDRRRARAEFDGVGVDAPQVLGELTAPEPIRPR